MLNHLGDSSGDGPRFQLLSIVMTNIKRVQGPTGAWNTVSSCQYPLAIYELTTADESAWVVHRHLPAPVSELGINTTNHFGSWRVDFAQSSATIRWVDSVGVLAIDANLKRKLRSSFFSVFDWFKKKVKKIPKMVATRIKNFIFILFWFWFSNKEKCLSARSFYLCWFEWETKKFETNVDVLVRSIWSVERVARLVDLIFQILNVCLRKRINLIKEHGILIILHYLVFLSLQIMHLVMYSSVQQMHD